MSDLVKSVENTDIAAIEHNKLISVLQSSLYVDAKKESIELVLSYCKASGFDVMQKPVHIVPMNKKNKSTGQWESNDIIMPGIGMYRIQADRSGSLAGITEPEFGPMIEHVFTDKYNNNFNVAYPEWCKITVKKIVAGMICDFTVQEFWTENYATMGGTNAPNAMWKKRPRGQLAKCFDEETEILTSHGFQKFSKVTGNIAQVTEDGLELCDSIPFSQNYDGDMILSDGTCMNFCVTPNHDMVTNNGIIEAGYLFELATTDSNKIAIPSVISNNNKSYPVDDNTIKLLGYYLADGYHSGYHQLRISVSRDYKIKALNSLCLHSRMSIKKGKGSISFIKGRRIETLNDYNSYSYDFDLINNFVDSDKKVNIEELSLFSKRQSKLLIDSMIEFDGSDNGSGVLRFHQNINSVLECFEFMSIMAGYSISKRLKGFNHSSTTISKKKKISVVKGLKKNKSSLKIKKNKTGKVWCVTVPSGIIIVRRHGMSMICGNCSEAQALRKAFPEIGSVPTAEEMEGKYIEPTYSQHTDNYINNNTPENSTSQEGVIEDAEIVDSTPPYPHDRFIKKLEQLKIAIPAGKITADDFFGMVESKNTLTEEQKDIVRGIK